MFTLPDAELDTGNVSLETGNASLARFSKTSRRMAAIAQPYLFHYFATGRQIRIGEDGKIVISSLYDENGRLARFLRTIMQRPELAVRVKALRLAPQPADHRNTHGNNRTATPVEVLRQARSGLGDAADDAFFCCGFSWAMHGKKLTDSAIYHGLEQLAIVLCPNADTVVLGDEQPSSRPWNIFVSRIWTFPSLKRAELLLYNPSGPVTLARHVFDKAPNIETLHVAHLTRPTHLTVDTNWGTSWATTLPSVRRLVASDISVTDLAALVKSCPQLRDLEYKHHSRRALSCRVRGRELREALQPARKTLRRLLLVIMANSDPRGDMMPGASIGTLKDFDALEELVINQNQVAGGFVVVGQAAPLTSLTKFLPRSIKHVEFLNIWYNFNPDLEGLLQDAPVELPNLRSLRFNHFERQKDENPGDWFPSDKDEYEYERVRESFAAVSISLDWGGISKRPRREKGLPGPEA